MKDLLIQMQELKTTLWEKETELRLKNIFQWAWYIEIFVNPKLVFFRFSTNWALQFLEDILDNLRINFERDTQWKTFTYKTTLL